MMSIIGACCAAQITSDSEAGERHAKVGSSSGRVDSDVLAQTDTLASVD